MLREQLVLEAAARVMESMRTDVEEQESALD